VKLEIELLKIIDWNSPIWKYDMNIVLFVEIWFIIMPKIGDFVKQQN
jgi:hypothetical protein